jgi:hypothetical protein
VQTLLKETFLRVSFSTKVLLSNIFLISLICNISGFSSCFFSSVFIIDSTDKIFVDFNDDYDFVFDFNDFDDFDFNDNVLDFFFSFLSLSLFKLIHSRIQIHYK